MKAAGDKCFPVNVKDWGHFRKMGSEIAPISDAWGNIKATIDLSDERTKALEDRIRITVENKLGKSWNCTIQWVHLPGYTSGIHV